VDEPARSAEDRFRKYSGELSLLLWAMWNPIGFDVPLDEYERYVPAVWKLLEERAASEAIEAELARICAEWIEVDAGTHRAAAEMVSRWWYWRFDYPEHFAADDG
jgi:hypothetical protein